MKEWISVKDNLPEFKSKIKNNGNERFMSKYVCMMNDDIVFVGRFEKTIFSDGYIHYWFKPTIDGDECYVKYPTHWCDCIPEIKGGQNK